MKTVFLIAIELKHPESIKNREAIENTIKSLTGWWWHHIESVWLIAGDDPLSASSIYEKLSTVLKLKDTAPDDSLFIVRINPAERQGWLPKTAWDWLRKVSGQAPSVKQA